MDSFFKTPLTPKKTAAAAAAGGVTTSPFASPTAAPPPVVKTEDALPSSTLPLTVSPAPPLPLLPPPPPPPPSPSPPPPLHWDVREQCTPTSQPRRCCDYHRHFLTFFVKQHMTLAPEQPFQRDPEARATVRQAIDRALALPHNAHVKKEDRDDDHDMMDVGEGDAPVIQTRGITKEEMAELLHMPPHKMTSRLGKAPPYRTRDIIVRAENPDHPGPPLLWLVSRTKPKPLTSLHYLQLLNRLPHKFLKFAEDVRPPYSGTFTKCPNKRGLRTGRNPFERALPGTDYNYDSEAEWVADEDGEELLSDEDDDDHSDGGGADSIDGFLDDEDDTVAKRGGMAALIPTNSGICWEDALGRAVRPDLEEMRIGVLIGTSTLFSFFSRRFFV